MARLARVVAPGLPHHVTQRGNRRQQTFFSDDDYATDTALLAEHCAAARAAVWAWCLMPNHVHLILVPPEADSLRASLGEAHRRYTRHVNSRAGWRGFLWQGRFASCPMDEAHLLTAARYVERNPVRAKLARRPRDWRWSSARAHLAGRATGWCGRHRCSTWSGTGGRSCARRPTTRRGSTRCAPASAPAVPSAQTISSPASNANSAGRWRAAAPAASRRTDLTMRARRGCRSKNRYCRGRDAHYCAPPAQNRTSPIKASGSHLG
jgi:putative transposase